MNGAKQQPNDDPVDSKPCPTGVEGLDEILAGGLPRDCFYLIQGDPGSGKTTLALQFLFEGREFQGVLTGVPVFCGKQQRVLKASNART